MTGGRLRSPLALDVLICAALLAFGVSVTTRSDLANGTVLDTLLLAAVVLPIVARRRWPLAASLALLTGAVISGVPTFDQFRLGLAIPAGMLIVFALASTCALGRALGGLALVLAAMVFIGLTDRVLRGHGGVAAMAAFSFPLCLASWGAGRAAWSRHRLADRLAVQSELLARQRELTAELAVEVERTRLASELDIAARAGVRAITQVAERGEELCAAQLEGVRVAFGEIERIGRGALNEMRDLLGILRSDEQGSRSPRPTLTEIETLLRDARARGRLVDLEFEGEQQPLPLGVELASYRALQHALDAVDDTDGEPVTVQLRYHAESLELEVRGVPSDGPHADAALVSAREWIVAEGGRFRSEARSGRRLLRAEFPIAVSHA